MKSFLRAKETLGRYKRSWLVPDVIWLFPVMWKNGVGLKHKGKEEKEWKMQNEQNKKRISMIIPSSETGSEKWKQPLLCLQHSKQLQMYSEIKITKILLYFY